MLDPQRPAHASSGLAVGTAPATIVTAPPCGSASVPNQAPVNGQFQSQQLLQPRPQAPISGQFSSQQLLQPLPQAPMTGQFQSQQLFQPLPQAPMSGQFQSQQLLQPLPQAPASGQFLSQQFAQPIPQAPMSVQSLQLLEPSTHRFGEPVEGMPEGAYYGGQLSLNGLFNQLDFSRNGQLTREEFIRALQNNGGTFPGWELLAPQLAAAQGRQIIYQPVVVGTQIQYVDVPVPTPVRREVNQTTASGPFRTDNDFPYHDFAFGTCWRYHYPDSIDERVLHLDLGKKRHATPLEELRHEAFVRAMRAAEKEARMGKKPLLSERYGPRRVLEPNYESPGERLEQVVVHHGIVT